MQRYSVRMRTTTSVTTIGATRLASVTTLDLAVAGLQAPGVVVTMGLGIMIMVPDHPVALLVGAVTNTGLVLHPSLSCVHAHAPTVQVSLAFISNVQTKPHLTPQGVHNAPCLAPRNFANPAHVHVTGASGWLVVHAGDPIRTYSAHLTSLCINVLPFSRGKRRKGVHSGVPPV